MDALELAGEWRADAEMLRHRGAPHQADTLESAAADLEEWWRSWWSETLTLEEAADEAGVSYDAIRKRLQRGTLPNAGANGSKRVRRCDLFPELAGATLTTEDGDPDLAAEILRARGAS